MWIGAAAAMLAWLLGIGAQLTQAEVGAAHWGWLLPCGVAALVAVLSRTPWWSSAACRTGAACALCACLGWGQTEWRAALLLAQNWPLAWQDRPVLLTGRIANASGPRAEGGSLVLEVEVESVEGPQGQRWRAGEAWALAGQLAGGTCPRRVRLFWSVEGASPGSQGRGAAPPPVEPGQVWRWPVMLRAPFSEANPGGFEGERWMFAHGLRAEGSVKVVTPKEARSSRRRAQRSAHAAVDAGAAEVDAEAGMGAKGEPAALPAAAPLLLRPASAWSSRIERWRQALQQRIDAHVQDRRAAGLIAGLTIGAQSAISPQDWDVLRNTGTAHLASISGLHITMLAWLGMVGTGWLWRRSPRLIARLPAPVAATWAGVATAWGYALLAGWGVPAQRTVLMLGMVALLRLGGRRWPWPLVLLAAAVAVTLMDPWALVQPGFWLSFVAVALLLLSGQAAQEEPGEAPASWQVRARRLVAGFTRTQVLAFFGLAPLSLVYFQQVAVVGLLANAVAVPLFTLVLAPLSLLGLLLPAVWGLLTPLVGLVFSALSSMAAWPWAMASWPLVTGWAAALAIAGTAWCLAPLPWRQRALALPVLAPLLWPVGCSQALPPPPQGQFEVLAADIGQGTSVVVRTARHVLVYDAGPLTFTGRDAGRDIVAGLLRALGVDRLDLLMISHGDMDHIGGAPSVLRAVRVGQTSTSLEPGHAFLRLADAAGRVPFHRPCTAGQRWVWDGVEFEVVHPTPDDWAHREQLGDNGMSCVLRIAAAGPAGRSALLTGDIERPQEAALHERLGARLKSEVLVVPHHGSRTSSTPPFLEDVDPEVAVIQAGERNRYKHPNGEVVARYLERGTKVVLAPRCGAWRWRSGEGPARDAGRCWRDEVRRYWQRPASEVKPVASPA